MVFRTNVRLLMIVHLIKSVGSAFCKPSCTRVGATKEAMLLVRLSAELLVVTQVSARLVRLIVASLTILLQLLL